MRSIGRLGLPLAITGAVVGILACPLCANQADLEALLDGVKVVNASGLPGPVCAFGDEAFAVVVGKVKGGAELPLVVATRFGKGRALGFGKPEFFAPQGLALADTGRFMVNAARWAAGKTGPIAVGVFKDKPFAEALTKQGLPAREVTLDDLDAIDVLFVKAHGVPDEGLEKLSRFVADGNGLLAADLGWGWLQLNPGKTLTQDNRSNKLLAPMGIVWADGMLDRTTDSGYLADETSSPLTNASAALDAVLAHSKGELKLTSKQTVQVTASLSRTALVIPPNDRILLPRLRVLTKDETIDVVPTKEKPIKRDDALARLVLTMQLRDAKELPAEQVRAHPAAATFPGLAPADAPRVTRGLSINTAIPGWHSTGLFAAAGELITVEVPEAAADKELKVRFGSTTCRNWHHAKWLRAPEVTREYALKQPTTRAANAFGGLVYITVPNDCALGAVSVSIADCVEAPHFVLGETSLEEWKNTVRKLPAPRAELASAKAILSVPSEVIRDLDDPEPLLRLWDRVLDLCAELAAWPSPDRKRPQRYTADLQICAGYMHAGNPIMLPTSAAPDLVNVDHLLHKGDWGLYHETGHMHQHRDWTFGGTGEVTVNLFTLYVLDKLCGIPVADGRMASAKTLSSTLKHLSGGADFDQWRRKPFLALTMYVQLQQAFGWDAYKQVCAEYRDLPDDERPENDDEKRDQWMVRFSRNVGRNLGPFFEAWGVPTSYDARASINDLPVWWPESFPPKHPELDVVPAE